MPQFDLAYNEDWQRNIAPFPAHIATTADRPDGIIFSKAVLWLELTSPWKENLTESYIRSNKLESECSSKGRSGIPLYLEVAALGHVNTTWGMMSKAIGMKRVGRKWLRLKCSKIALHLSHLPVPQANRMVGTAAHALIRAFPANEPPQRLTQSCTKSRSKLTK